MTDQDARYITARVLCAAGFPDGAWRTDTPLAIAIQTQLLVLSRSAQAHEEAACVAMRTDSAKLIDKAFGLPNSLGDAIRSLPAPAKALEEMLREAKLSCQKQALVDFLGAMDGLQVPQHIWAYVKMRVNDIQRLSTLESAEKGGE